MTPKQITQHFGVTRRTVYRWIERGCPVETTYYDGSTNPKHKMDLKAVTNWRRKQWTEE